MSRHYETLNLATVAPAQPFEVEGGQPLALDSVSPLRLANSRPGSLVAAVSPESLGAEQYRRLAIRLQHLRTQRPLSKLLISSAAPHEGKSLSAANLALTLARPCQQRVLLLEGDLHRPALLARLGAQHGLGLADWLQQRAPLNKCLARWPDLPLWVLPASRATRPPLELLQAQSPARLLSQLDASFDWIVIDSPPLLPLADACHWAQAADGVLMVVRANRTRRSDLELALRQLDRSNWLGVIFNDCHAAEHRYYTQYYPGRAS